MRSKLNLMIAAAPLAVAALCCVSTPASADPLSCDYTPSGAGPDGSSGTADDVPATIVCGSTSFVVTGSTVIGRGEVSEGGTAIGQYVIIEPANDFSDTNITNGAQFPDASVGIGYRVRVDGDRNVAVGANARIGGEFGETLSVSDATAIGSTTRVLGEGGTAVGSKARALSDGTTVVGSGSTAAGEGSTVLGYISISTAPGGIAIGRNTFVNETEFGTINTVAVPDLVGGVAVGDRARVSGNDGLALGAYSVVGVRNRFETVDNGTAVGAASNVAAEGGTALGARTSVTGTNGVAIGNGVSVANAGAVAIGASSQASADNAIAIGTGAVVSAANSVAVGAGSVADRGNSFSVGTAGAERQITNVAAGAEDTDAVNVAQLRVVEAKADAAQTTANAALVVATQGVDDASAAQATANAAVANAAAAQETADMAVANNARQDGELDAIRAVDTRQDGELAAIRTVDTRQDGEIAAAQATADTAIVRSDALGAGTAAALGGGSTYDDATGAVSAPSYTIGGQSYGNVGAAFDAVDDRLMQVDTRIDVLSAATDRGFRRANGGIAAAMALGGTMIVPDSTVSLSFNLATYRGEQGFSGTVAVRAAPRVYVSGGFAGSTVRGSTGGRVGLAIGF